MKWKLLDHAPLRSWVHRDGKLALLGDSCHPMLVRAFSTTPFLALLTLVRNVQPYRAQGAAMAVGLMFFCILLDLT